MATVSPRVDYAGNRSDHRVPAAGIRRQHGQYRHRHSPQTYLAGFVGILLPNGYVWPLSVVFRPKAQNYCRERSDRLRTTTTTIPDSTAAFELWFAPAGSNESHSRVGEDPIEGRGHDLADRVAPRQVVEDCVDGVAQLKSFAARPSGLVGGEDPSEDLTAFGSE